MKQIIPFISLVSLLLGPLCMADDQKPPSGGELLDSVLKAPGDFDQMCSEDLVTQGVPIPLFRSVQRQMFNVSDKNLAALRAQRAQVVPVLVQRLATWETGKSTPEAKAVTGTMTFALGPGSVRALYYQIIAGLDAVETLPELLRIEDQTHQRLTTMEAAKKTEQELWQVRVDQRELLSVMLQLLRSQRFQPLLDSDFEKNYATAIKARAAEKDLAGIKTAEEAKAKGAAFDPIYHIAVGYMNTKPEIPYTEKRR